MANIGMRKVFIAKRTASGTYDVTGGLESCGHAVSVNLTPTWAEGQNYGDDMQVDSDSEFVSAALALGTTNVPAPFHNTMFGNTVSQDGKTITHNKDDEPPFVGTGFIGVEKVDNVRSFVASFLPKVKFREPDSTLNTKTNSITYSNPTVNGTVFTEDNGDWKIDEICTTEAAAVEWLQGKFGVTASNGGNGSAGGYGSTGG